MASWGQTERIILDDSSRGDGEDTSLTISAYVSMRRSGRLTPSRVAPQEILALVPANMGWEFFVLYILSHFASFDEETEGEKNVKQHK